jgi:hypothetical protein
MVSDVASERVILRNALMEQLRSDEHSIKSLDFEDFDGVLPVIVIKPILRSPVLRSPSNAAGVDNPPVFKVLFRQDGILIVTSRVTGNRTFASIQYEDPDMLESFAYSLAKLGVRVVS